MKTLLQPSIPLILQLAAWFFCLYWLGAERLHTHYESALILFAAILLVPAGLEALVWRPGAAYWVAVSGFAAAYLAPVAFGPVFALPYLLYALWLSGSMAHRLWKNGFSGIGNWARVFAAGYWMVAAGWSMCWLLRWYPLDFDPVITHLTSAHFHMAGFGLTVLLLRMNHLLRTRWSGGILKASLAGMPLVALGITGTRLGWPPVFESVLAIGFVALVFAAIGLLIQVCKNNKHPLPVRLGCLLCACCLSAGMVLATLYALRFDVPLDWINIPNMKIWHGTLNVIALYTGLRVMSYEL